MSALWHTSVRSKVVPVGELKSARFISEVPPDDKEMRRLFTPPIVDLEPELRREARKRVVKAWFWFGFTALLGLALWVAERWKP